MASHPSQVPEAIEKLKQAAKDPKFISRLKTEPAAALREAGIEWPKGDPKDFDQVTKRATEDPTYRLRLKREPIAVLHEAGIEVPAGVEVRVLELDPNVRYMFIPAKSSGEKGEDS